MSNAGSVPSLVSIMKGPKIKAPKIAIQPDRVPSLIAQQNRRVTGNTPKLLKQFQESPARWLPRAKGLRAIGSGGKIKAKVVM